MIICNLHGFHTYNCVPRVWNLRNAFFAKTFLCHRALIFPPKEAKRNFHLSNYCFTIFIKETRGGKDKTSNIEEGDKTSIKKSSIKQIKISNKKNNGTSSKTKLKKISEEKSSTIKLKPNKPSESNVVLANTSINTSETQQKPTASQSRTRQKPYKSELLKVIKYKKMLERYRASSTYRKKSTEGRHAIPSITVDSDYRDQLQQYISNYDDKWEIDETNLHVGKTGKVLMFPLWKKQEFCEDLSHSGASSTKTPSVTSILRVTKPMRQVLSLLRWENQMVTELGEQEFHKMRQGMFDDGHEIHKSIEKYLIGTSEEDLDLTPKVIGYWKSCMDVLHRVGTLLEFEVKVQHPALSYSGYVDCIAEFDGKVSLIEWKTSRKPKRDLSKAEDYPLQAVAYLGAVNFDPIHTIQVEQIVIGVMYQDGQAATVHILDKSECSFYWSKWLGRLQEFRDIAEMKTAFIRGKIIAWRKSQK